MWNALATPEESERHSEESKASSSSAVICSSSLNSIYLHGRDFCFVEMTLERRNVIIKGASSMMYFLNSRC